MSFFGLPVYKLPTVRFPAAMFRSGWFRSGWFRSGWIRSGWFRSGWFSTDWFRSGWFRSGWFRSGCFHPARFPFFSQPALRLWALLIVLSAACDRGSTPKPSGYVRVDYPEKEYVLFDEPDPYSFEIPVYTKVVPASTGNAEPYWYDLKFPGFRGTVHISYKPVRDDVEEYIKDTRTLVYKHTSRADGISEVPFVDPDNKRYGILYELGGDVASPVQFFLTDSTDHFLRGSLYFNTTVNRDSLNPIIIFVQKDIEHLIETVRWK